MKPGSVHLLQTIASTLASDIYPRVETSYHQSMLAQIIELLVGIAGEFDQAASNLVEENQKYRDLFRICNEKVMDSALKERLIQAVETTDTDLRVTSLDKANQELTKLLIDLQTHLESIDDEKSRELNESIWQELMMRAMRRLAVITQGANAAQVAPLKKAPNCPS